MDFRAAYSFFEFFSAGPPHCTRYYGAGAI